MLPGSEPIIETGRKVLDDLRAVLDDPSDRARRTAEAQVLGIYYALKCRAVLPDLPEEVRDAAREGLIGFFGDTPPVIATPAQAGFIAEVLREQVALLGPALAQLPQPLPGVGWPDFVDRGAKACDLAYAFTGTQNGNRVLGPAARTSNAASVYLTTLRGLVRSQVKLSASLPPDLEVQLFDRLDQMNRERDERLAEVRKANAEKPKVDKKAKATGGASPGTTPVAASPVAGTGAVPVAPTPAAGSPPVAPPPVAAVVTPAE